MAWLILFAILIIGGLVLAIGEGISSLMSYMPLIFIISGLIGGLAGYFFADSSNRRIKIASMVSGITAVTQIPIGAILSALCILDYGIKHTIAQFFLFGIMVFYILGNICVTLLAFCEDPDLEHQCGCKIAVSIVGWIIVGVVFYNYMGIT